MVLLLEILTDGTDYSGNFFVVFELIVIFRDGRKGTEGTDYSVYGVLLVFALL